MSVPHEFQIPNQPYIPAEVDVSLHESNLQSVEVATELNGVRSDLQEIYRQQQPEAPAVAERSRLLIGQVGVNMGIVRKEALKDAA